MFEIRFFFILSTLKHLWVIYVCLLFLHGIGCPSSCLVNFLLLIFYVMKSYTRWQFFLHKSQSLTLDVAFSSPSSQIYYNTWRRLEIVLLQELKEVLGETLCFFEVSLSSPGGMFLWEGIWRTSRTVFYNDIRNFYKSFQHSIFVIHHRM